MDSVIGIIRGKSSDYKAILQAVNDNIEVITHCASAISPEDTPLLRIISDLNTPEHAYGVALLLTLQSRNVHPQSSNSFSKNVRELFSNLQNSPKKQYEQFYLSAGREGRSLVDTSNPSSSQFIARLILYSIRFRQCQYFPVPSPNLP